jgi:hypothetical protein
MARDTKHCPGCRGYTQRWEDECPGITAGGTPLSDADIRLNAEGDVLDIVTRYGGETIVSGPPMSGMVRELGDLVVAWRNGGRP